MPSDEVEQETWAEGLEADQLDEGQEPFVDPDPATIHLPDPDPSRPVDRGRVIAEDVLQELDSSASSASEPVRVLKLGDSGEDVRSARERLGLPEGDVFDLRMFRHVKNLQRAALEEPTGELAIWD